MVYIDRYPTIVQIVKHKLMFLKNMDVTIGRYGENMDLYNALRDCQVLVNGEVLHCDFFHSQAPSLFVSLALA